jgi:hypothetical protein
VTNTAPQPAPLDASVSAPPHARPERARFDAFFAHWFPRLYRLAASQLSESALAESATRAVLAAAVRNGLVGAQGDVGPRLLALARTEIARIRRPHGFVI